MLAPISVTLRLPRGPSRPTRVYTGRTRTDRTPPRRRPMPSLNVMLFGTGSNVVVTAGVARGVFSRHGLTLDITYTQGSEMLCETLRTGGCDIGVLAADDVVYEVERRGLDFFLFMGIHTGLLS